MIKLIAVDIDGTLLNDQGQILPATIQAVKQATAAGKKSRAVHWSAALWRDRLSQTAGIMAAGRPVRDQL